MTEEGNRGRTKNPLSFFFLKNRHHSVPSSSPADQRKGVFGAPLEYGAECGTVTPRGLQVPDPVYRCMSEIIQRGLAVEGIFRLSGAASEVDQLCRLFDTPPTFGKTLDLSTYDIHAIISTLKKYLRCLPTPVIPAAYHDEFLEIDDMVQLAQRAIQQLPRPHFVLLYTIIELCSHIQAHAHLNLMNPQALAVVLAPVCTGLDQRLKHAVKKNNVADIVQANARWMELWTQMIACHRILLDTWSVDPTAQRLLVVNVALPKTQLRESSSSGTAASDRRRKQYDVIVMRKRQHHCQTKHASWPVDHDRRSLVGASTGDPFSLRRRARSMVDTNILPL